MKSQTSFNVGLIVTLIICLWIGWSDYLLNNFETSTQEVRNEIRGSIRLYIRYGIQLTIKFLIPISIVGFFIRKLKSRN